MKNLDHINAVLAQVSQVKGVDKAAIATIQQAVADGRTEFVFDGIDRFTLTQLQEAGFEINLLDMPYAGEGGEA